MRIIISRNGVNVVFYRVWLHILQGSWEMIRSLLFGQLRGQLKGKNNLRDGK